MTVRLPDKYRPEADPPYPEGEDPTAYRLSEVGGKKEWVKKSQRGFLGPVKNLIDGGTMTEFSTDMETDRGRIMIPTMVSTLSQEEIEHMRRKKGGEGWNRSDPIEESILRKAKTHAMDRLKRGMDPFYRDGEEFEMPDIYREGGRVRLI